MKKYYGLFIYDGEEYVIRFKIKGSLSYDSRHGCFMDSQWYTRSVDDVIVLAALNANWFSRKAYSVGWLLTHQQFIEARASGIKRWKPEREVIDWP